MAAFAHAGHHDPARQSEQQFDRAREIPVELFADNAPLKRWASWSRDPAAGRNHGFRGGWIPDGNWVRGRGQNRCFLTVPGWQAKATIRSANDTGHAAAGQSAATQSPPDPAATGDLTLAGRILYDRPD